jgi:hypothetical protein
MVESPEMLLDESQFPIVFLNLDEGESMAALLDGIEEAMKRGKYVVIIADGTRGMKASIGAVERKAAATFIKTRGDVMKLSVAGLATVSTSTIVRGVITALRWVAPLPVPDGVFATRERAVEWAQQKLAEHAAA